MVKTVSSPKKIFECNLLQHTRIHTQFRVGWWRQRLASTPLAGSTQSTGHTIESGSRSAGLGLRAGGGGGEREIERKEPPIPNYSKLFCWMTDFISDQKQERKTEGGVRV